MPLVACPKCATNLKIPDGASGNVKCPKCASVFAVGAKPAAAPAFEVVDEPPKPAARAAAKQEVLDPDFEVVDEPKPKKKKVVVADDDDDDDDDDRPRSKRRRDDDDDDDDRPRKKKKKRRDYDDEEEEEDWRPAGKAGAGAAKVGMLLLVISLWMYFGTFALLGLLLLIAWLGAAIPSGLMIVPGLIGLANWVLALIGLGFCIAGPSRARGLAIATTAVAAVHLVMGFIVANDLKSSLFGSHSIEARSSYNRMERFWRLSRAAMKNPNGPEAKELKEEMASIKEDRDDLVGLGFAMQMMGSQATNQERVDLDKVLKDRKVESKMRWGDLATLFPFSDRLIAVLSYNSHFFSEYILSMLSGFLEVARLILLALTIGAVARALKAHDAADKATYGLIAGAIAIGVAMLISLLVQVMLDSHASDIIKKMKNPPSAETSRNEDSNPMKEMMGPPKNYMAIGDLLIFGLHGGTLMMLVLAAHATHSAASRRAR